MKFIINLTVVLVVLSISNHSHATASHVNDIGFFQENFDLTLFEQNTKNELEQLISQVNSGNSDLSLESDIKSFIDLGFSDDLNNSKYFCSTKGCVLFLGLNPESNKASKYRSKNYISNIDTNYWYDFKSKDVFESNHNYYLFLLK
jgi:hypothetical protein